MIKIHEQGHNGNAVGIRRLGAQHKKYKGEGNNEEGLKWSSGSHADTGHVKMEGNSSVL